MGAVKALELQHLQITAESMPWDAIGEVNMAVLNISFNPALSGDVSGLPSSLSILDARGTQFTIHDTSTDNLKALAPGLYADIESDPYIVAKAGEFFPVLLCVGHSVSHTTGP